MDTFRFYMGIVARREELGKAAGGLTLTAAKDAFDKMEIKKLPRVKELSAEYAAVLEEKKKLYAEYRIARAEMQEYQKAKRNVEMFFEAEMQEEQEKEKQENIR